MRAFIFSRYSESSAYRCFFLSRSRRFVSSAFSEATSNSSCKIETWHLRARARPDEVESGCALRDMRWREDDWDERGLPSLGRPGLCSRRLGCLCSSASPIIRAAATISQAGDQPRGIRLFLVRIVPGDACIADEMARRAVLVRIIDAQGHARHPQADGACAALLNEHGVSRPRTWVSSTKSKPSPRRDGRGRGADTVLVRSRGRAGGARRGFRMGTPVRDPSARSRESAGGTRSVAH